MTYRSSRLAGSRKHTPAELMFGRQISHPLISFNGGEWLWYCGRKDRPAMKARFLVQRSPRTIYVETQQGNVALAHLDQVKVIKEEIEDGNRTRGEEMNSSDEVHPKQTGERNVNDSRLIKVDTQPENVKHTYIRSKSTRTIIKPFRYQT